MKDTTSLTEITDLKKLLNRTNEESTRMKNQIDELQKRLENAGKFPRNSFDQFPFFCCVEKQIEDKDKLILTKTSEINSMEERYVQYLEKAKMILRQMDPRNNNSVTNQELHLLKKQIEEKDRKLKDLDVNSICFQREF